MCVFRLSPVSKRSSAHGPGLQGALQGAQAHVECLQSDFPLFTGKRWDWMPLTLVQGWPNMCCWTANSQIISAGDLTDELFQWQNSLVGWKTCRLCPRRLYLNKSLCLLMLDLCHFFPVRTDTMGATPEKSTGPIIREVPSYTFLCIACKSMS